MNRSSRRSVLLIATLGWLGCSSATQFPPAVHDQDPKDHRPQAVPCPPTATAPSPPGGGAACATDGDCAGDAGRGLFTHCLRGRCAFDACLADGDCAGGRGVCGCSTDYYGGNAAYHPNICVAASCHQDADCGAGGFCSPTRGLCGVFEGFYCHRPSDSCYNDWECVPSGACVYSPMAGAWACAQGPSCNG
jgi:hypothetical protein